MPGAPSVEQARLCRAISPEIGTVASPIACAFRAVPGGDAIRIWHSRPSKIGSVFAIPRAVRGTSDGYQRPDVRSAAPVIPSAP